MKMSAFGQFIRKYRIDHNLILKDMADRLGVSSSFLSAIELGTKEIPYDFEKRLCDLFDFNEQERAGLQTSMDESRTRLNMPISSDTLERQIAGAFCRNLSSLDDERKKQILDLLRSK